MQFVVTAYDFQDAEAIDRRLAMRKAHLAGITRMVESGNFLSGGAILDESGKMIGSSAHVEFATRVELETWLKSDPYASGRVWDRVDVRPIKLLSCTKP